MTWANGNSQNKGGSNQTFTKSLNNAPSQKRSCEKLNCVAVSLTLDSFSDPWVLEILFVYLFFRRDHLHLGMVMRLEWNSAWNSPVLRLNSLQLLSGLLPFWPIHSSPSWVNLTHMKRSLLILPTRGFLTFRCGRTFLRCSLGRKSPWEPNNWRKNITTEKSQKGRDLEQGI